MLLFFFSCKVEKKNAVDKNAYNLTKLKPKSNKMVVTAINGKYMLQDSSTIKVFVLMEISNTDNDTKLEDLNSIFRLSWNLQTEYGIKEKIKNGKLTFTENVIAHIGKEYKLVFEVPRPIDLESGVLILDIVDIAGAVKYTNDLPIDFKGQKIDTRYNIFENKESIFPNFTTYAEVGKSFVIKSILENSDKLFLKKYNNKTKAALSPMSSTRRDFVDEFDADKVIDIISGQIVTLTEPGVYVLTREPSLHSDGFGFLVVEDRFPRQTYPEELMQSLVYMSTPKEIEALNTGNDAKESLDLYFLNVAKGNQTMARQIIKSYYNRVADANKLFSTFKEGWKTDKGMVYIIMGPPSRVQRNRLREVWLYSQSQNNSEIIFTFYRKSNVFSDQTFELVRYPEYSSFWYPYVEAWRTGNVVE